MIAEDAASRVPRHGVVQWHVDEQARVALRRRKFGAVGTAFLRLFRVKPDLTVRLDPLGSAVWQLIDGQRTAHEILVRLQAQFPQEGDLPQRLGQYLSTLASNGFIELD